MDKLQEAKEKMHGCIRELMNGCIAQKEGKKEEEEERRKLDTETDKETKSSRWNRKEANKERSLMEGKFSHNYRCLSF